MRYRLLEHTGDLKVEIYGRDLAELFANAGYMVFDVMVERDQIKEVERKDLVITSSDLEELFLDWLRELLFLFSTKGFVVKSVDIKSVEPKSAILDATLFGEDYEPQRHGLKIEIKTPTYHQFNIESTPDGYRASVVFDV